MLNSTLRSNFKLLSLFICVFIFSCTRKQDNKFTSDILLQQADNLLESNSLKSLEYAQKANFITEKSNDSKRKAETYYYIAFTLNILEEYEKSLPFIEKGLKEHATKVSPPLKARFLSLKGYHYSRLHLYKQQAKQHQEVIDLTISRKDPESVMTASLSLSSLGLSYTIVNDYTNAHHFIDIALKHAKTVPDTVYHKLKKIYKVKANLFYYKAMTHIEQLRAKEALPFIQQAYQQAIVDNKPLTLFHELYADYYMQIGKTEEAIEFYLLAIADKKKRTWNRSTSADLYLKISKSYNKINQYKEGEKFLRLSAAERLIDENKNRKRVQAILDNIENHDIIIKNRDNQLKIILCIALLITLLLFIWKYREYKQKKKKILFAQKIEIEQNKQLIETLELKVNESFSELIELAKKNSPTFWARFQEVHPKFLKRMLCIDANFKSSELILCAYIYLGFSTKEIADYTFKATKTIENNRYNLRKKLGLAPEEDLILWLRNRVDDNPPTEG